MHKARLEKRVPGHLNRKLQVCPYAIGQGPCRLLVRMTGKEPRAREGTPAGSDGKGQRVLAVLALLPICEASLPLKGFSTAEGPLCVPPTPTPQQPCFHLCISLQHPYCAVNFPSKNLRKVLPP